MHTTNPVYQIVKPSNANLKPGKDGLRKAATILLQTYGLVPTQNADAQQAILSAVYALETAQNLSDDKRRVQTALQLPLFMLPEPQQDMLQDAVEMEAGIVA